MATTDKQAAAQRMHNFFKRLWDQREDESGNCYCFETGRLLPFSYRQNTCCYYHVLPKNRYPEYALEDWNIVILHPEIHEKVEKDIDLCPKVKVLTQKLKEKYGNIRTEV